MNRRSDRLLSAQQKKFVQEYLVDLNGGAAARRAGYSEVGCYTQAGRLLRNAEVAAAVEKALAKRGERLEIKADRVVKELARVAFSDIRQVAKWDKKGVQHFDSDELDDDASAAIMEVNEKQTIKVQRGEGGKAEKATIINREKRVKLHDKMKALKLLGMYVGMFKADPPPSPPAHSPALAAMIGFSDFCAKAGYPPPFVKQEEMRAFVFDDESNTSRMLLGARGYGKTDYTTILGSAYKLYLCRSYRILILTKSDDKNKAIVAEITKALEANGVPLFTATAHHIRVEVDGKDLHGKDHSVEALTILSRGIRGHHPDLIILDDPVTEDDVSESTRNKVEQKYSELVKLCANVVLIGQPVHVFDLYESLRPIVKTMEVPHGTIPELDHDLEAMKLAGITDSSINASYHLKVSSESGNPLAKVNFIDQFPQGGSVAFIDPSFRGGDYTAMSIGRTYMGGAGIAIQGHAWKKSWEDCLPAIIAAVVVNDVQKIIFETNSLGDMPVKILRQALKDAVDENGESLNLGHVVVVGRDSTGFKHSRIMAAGTIAKFIHIAKTSDRIYIQQTTKYEFKSKFDDSPDSLASLLECVGLIRGKIK